MLHSRPLNVFATLAPVRRGLGLARVRRWTVRGLGAGSLAGTVILITAHVWFLPLALRASIGAALAGALTGALLALWRWPDTLEAARLVDRHFALHDRLTTALEFQSSDHPLIALQRSEVARRLGDLRLRDSVRGLVGWRDPVLSGSAVLVLAGLLLLGLPSPSGASGTMVNGDQQRIEHAARTVPAILRRVEHGLPASIRNNPSLHAAHRTLARLQHLLIRARTRSDAFRSISQAQQELHEAASALPAGDAAAAAQLNRLLSRSVPEKGQPRAASTEQQHELASRTLKRMAGDVGHLNATQRAQMARALSTASATSTSGDLRASLRQASDSLSRADNRAASKALQGASRVLSRDAMLANAGGRLQTAKDRLDMLKNEIAGVDNRNTALPPAPTRPPRTGHNDGRAPETAPARVSGRSATSGQGRGARGSHGKGAGRQPGQGSGQGTGSRSNAGGGLVPGATGTQGRGLRPGQGGSGGRGSGGGGGNARTTGGAHFVTVYIPGREGKGPRTIQAGSGEYLLPGGRRVPYGAVVAHYTRAAHAALDHGAVPPGLQWYVRSYFTALSR